ncbi:HupE/UreJ family protein [Paenibacillus arenilitoris]|uniref:HupE/UreJ family protein n=1 Tax=Paenibacillus arenilitoris TaxID=2772299 RepID=A0A927CQE2_9BACL|nr:HupE/UreJ family protein [Paenibacillus arenilitoris]MBD2870026.1 HupE/UreJ family protein [Paenibacillus arenilitoris]
MKRIIRFIAALFAAFALTVPLLAPFQQPVSAHAMDNGYMDVQIESNEVYVELLLDFNDLASVVPLPVDLMSSLSVEELGQALDDRTEPLLDYVASGVKLYRDEVPVEPELVGTSVERVNEVPLARFQLVYSGDGDSTRIDYDVFIKDINKSHTNIAQINGPKGDQEFIFSIVNQELVVGERDWLRQAWQFILLGTEHIFTGYDHILFVLCLLPAARSLAGVVEVVTAFTVGHSLTLGLATFGVIQLPGRWVESAIAASIVFVAVQNLFDKNPKHRTIVTLLFGLVHGFGFSGILQEMALPRESLLSSLLFFNVGVEIGQIIIISMVFPLLAFFRHYRTYPRAVSVGSAAVIAIGLFWFIQRVFEF